MLLWVGTNTERHVSSLGSDETMSSQREATRAVNGDAQQTFELAEDLWPYLQLSIVDTNADLTENMPEHPSGEQNPSGAGQISSSEILNSLTQGWIADQHVSSFPSLPADPSSSQLHEYVQELHDIEFILKNLREHRTGIMTGMTILELCLQQYKAEVKVDMQQGACKEQVVAENMQTLFKVDAIDTEPAIRNQKSNFTCREDTHTQVMPEVQAMPKQTAALPKFTWLSTLESKCKVRSKIKKPRWLTYKCGYCSVKKSSSSTGKVFPLSNGIVC